MWLQKELNVGDGSQLGRIIAMQPPLLAYSISNNLQPTLDFFKMCLGDEEAVESAKRNPKMLSYGLESRLKPRLKQVKQAGIQIDSTMVAYICKKRDDQWQKFLAKRSNIL